MKGLNSIRIKKIKGIENKIFKLDLFPNKPTLLIAPNGFGKSSLATAFKSMNSNGIRLSKRDFFKNQDYDDMELEIKVDQRTYIADKNKNEILKEFDVFVINNSVYSKAVKHNQGKFVSVSSSMEIKSITIVETIPEKNVLDYKISKFKSDFGKNGKILPCAKDLFKNLNFWDKVNQFVDLSKLKGKRFTEKLLKFKDEINLIEGTSEEIKLLIENDYISALEESSGETLPEKELIKLYRLIFCNQKSSKADAALLSIQFIDLLNDKDFQKYMKYMLYLYNKDYFDRLLSKFNSSTVSIKTEEVNKSGKKSLVVNFPSADYLSNGERDILCFVLNIEKLKKQFKKDNCILIIDEIFDYLDDANLISFQYYIIDLIKSFKKNKKIYPILLTHLNPGYFKSYCFNKCKLQVRFLNKEQFSMRKSKFLNLIKFRDDETIKEDVDKYFLHFHIEEKEILEKFKLLGLPEDWSNNFKLYELVEKEVKKYLEEKTYDPIAIVLAVRVKIERILYDKLISDDDKDSFLKLQHGTQNKMDFCFKKGVDVCDTFYLLGIIYNENLHWYINRDYETPLYSKLENITVRKLIENIFINN